MKLLADPVTWKRLLWFVAGAGCLVVGVILINRDVVSQIAPAGIVQNTTKKITGAGEKVSKPVDVVIDPNAPIAPIK